MSPTTASVGPMPGLFIAAIRVITFVPLIVQAYRIVISLRLNFAQMR